ncbi:MULTISPECIES: zinc-dependent alcohol dehydrogenase family protein [Silvimonas]|uniref:zinc-dependent alcohol dehydrogenase family protein n=1 Tax=Silvimonas TaxID=300264 RepID=UPI0024B3AEB8|nr:MULTISPECIES: NAD(P)-dependent alcohol dehydrogenase [Silvimonas]MDR3429219.1 NAD(P)-dependent alcohol dehydrogenase [Silvimonas sp.]
MRAFVLDPLLSGSAALRLQPSRPTPALGPHDVLVRIRAASLNHRDLHIADRSREYPGRHAIVPLSDAAGEVVETGREVRSIRLGQRVVNTFYPDWTGQQATRENTRRTFGEDSDGVLSEFVVFNETGVLVLPEGLTFEEAATLPCAGVTAWHALMENAPLRPGDYVAVLGTGGVASIALQLAKAAGARVAVVSGCDDKLCRAMHMGADHGLNHQRVPDWDKALLDWTSGRGVDQVVDVAGNELDRSINATRVGGQVSLVGDLGGTSTALNAGALLARQIQLRGVSVGSRAMFQSLLQALSANRIRPVIQRVFGFDETPDAYNALRRGNHVGKLVVAF